MREIKFRGKRKDNGEWVFGDLLHFGKNTEILRDIPFGANESIKVIPESVGQFIGQQDKKSTDIYDGDILFNGIRQIVVGWDNYNCGWNVKEYGLHGYKVIGNVTDNPELIIIAEGV